MMEVKRMFLCILLRLTNVYAARILAIFPTPSISHQIVFRPLTQELARRGHEITVVTTDPTHSSDPDLINLIEIDVHNISYSTTNEDLLNMYGRDQLLSSQIYTLAQHFSNIFEGQLKTDELQAILRKDNKYYDLLLLEACFRPALVFTHIFKAPAIQVSSLGGMLINYEALGVPIHPLVYFNTLRHKLYDLTFWDKLTELKRFLYISYAHWRSEKLQNEMLQRHFGTSLPTISDLSNNIDMLFLATNPIWAGNVPVPPSVIYIGGIHENHKEEEMQKDLEFFLNTSSNGVIYLSFGTNVKTGAISSKLSRIFIKVFSKLNFNVVWKWDQSMSPEKNNSRIKYFKWVPQSQVLKHPNVKLFITQGGLQSTDEAITAGVPLLGIPMIADQWYNTEQYVHFNIGVKLDYNNLNEEKLRDALNKVIGDKSYRRNIARLRSLIQDQPQRPLERAVWWVEHVLRNGNGRHLRSPSANISWMEFLELELLLLLSITLIASILVINITAKYIWMLISKNILKTVKAKLN